MRTKRFLMYTVVTIAIVALAFAVYKLLSSDEEPPIIVKNGSMDLLAGDDSPQNHHWKWDRNGGPSSHVFVHEAAYPHSKVKDQSLQVYVIGTPTGGCTTITAGDTVKLDFTDGFSLTLTRFQLGSSNQFRTRIEPSTTDLDEVQGAPRPTLRHPSDNTHFIKSVTFDNSTTCTFASREALTQICISPDDPSKACALTQ
jgi:hypothetical protein